MLQKRIGRKVVSKKLLKEVPVVFQAFDLLEDAGEDVGHPSQNEGSDWIDCYLLEHPHLRRTELLGGSTWEEWAKTRDQSREKNTEGLMLKRWDASYEVGHVRGAWWKWKVSPFTIDAVLIYAQKKDTESDLGSIPIIPLHFGRAKRLSPLRKPIVG